MFYTDRVDFQAFDALVHAIDKASPAQLHDARKTALNMAADFSVAATKRALWRDFAKLINRAANR